MSRLKDERKEHHLASGIISVGRSSPSVGAKDIARLRRVPGARVCGILIGDPWWSFVADPILLEAGGCRAGAPL